MTSLKLYFNLNSTVELHDIELLIFHINLGEFILINFFLLNESERFLSFEEQFNGLSDAQISYEKIL